jgi:hypothetical protein
VSVSTKLKLLWHHPIPCKSLSDQDILLLDRGESDGVDVLIHLQLQPKGTLEPKTQRQSAEMFACNWGFTRAQVAEHVIRIATLLALGR